MRASYSAMDHRASAAIGDDFLLFTILVQQHGTRVRGPSTSDARRTCWKIIRYRRCTLSRLE
jgi:hypothetical protein